MSLLRWAIWKQTYGETIFMGRCLARIEKKMWMEASGSNGVDLALWTPPSRSKERRWRSSAEMGSWRCNEGWRLFERMLAEESEVEGAKGMCEAEAYWDTRHKTDETQPSCGHIVMRYRGNTDSKCSIPHVFLPAQQQGCRVHNVNCSLT